MLSELQFILDIVILGKLLISLKYGTFTGLSIITLLTAIIKGNVRVREKAQRTRNIPSLKCIYLIYLRTP
jgi:hypothetical protein